MSLYETVDGFNGSAPAKLLPGKQTVSVPQVAFADEQLAAVVAVCVTAPRPLTYQRLDAPPVQAAARLVDSSSPHSFRPPPYARS